MYLVIMGVQGAGKGTQAAFLKERFNIPHITSGGLFRAMKDQDTPLARQVQEILARGDLVPDDITIQIVRDRITQEDAREGFILDGFPRTRPQAEALDALMDDLGRELTAVVFLRISDEEAVERISGRLQCELDEKHIYHRRYNPPKVEGVCDVDGGKLFTREDDQPEAVRKRIAAFHEKTLPLLDYYRQKGLLVEVDAEKPIEAVTEGVVQALEEITAK
ncbi:MAG: adenylate kinase [Anaerolineae bacterium]